MAKKKVNKHNTPRHNNINYFDWGGDFKDAFKLGGGDAANLSTGLISSLSPIVGNSISGGLTSGAGNALQGLGNIASAIPGPWGAIASTGLNVLGGVTNKMFGSKLNQENINKIESNNNSLNNLSINDSSNEAIMSQFGNQDFGSNFTQSDIGSDGWFSHKARNKFNKLQEERNNALIRANNSYGNAINNVNTQMGLNALMNSFADGGKIHIKKANRGKFTEAANRANMGVQEYASHILANKERYSPTLVKRANFARNFGGRKANGGPLFTHGSYFPNGINEINNGGTHENNINGGVPQGVDNQGNPNLVEEGEVVWNDYVFSNRLKLNDDIKNMFNLRGKDLTFADAVKQIKKESEERPNDPISKRGLEDSMNKLMILQEGIRQKENKGNTFAQGGKLGYPWLEDEEPTYVPSGSGINPALYEDTFISNVPTKRDYTTGNTDILSKQLNNLNTTPIGTSKGSNRSNYRFNIGDLKYAPIVGSALSYAQNLINKPDYSRADTLIDAATKSNNFTPIKYKPIGNYLTYNPFDTEYYSNQLGAQAGATRRAIENTSGGNRANALAGILASDYNSTNQLGDLYRKANEYNQAQKERIEGFNRGTNQANSEMDLKTNMYNSEMEAKNKSMGLDYLMRGLAMKDAIDNARNTSMSANLTNLFDNLGNVGIDYLNRMDKDKLVDSGVFGILNEIMKDNNYYHNKYDNKKACGGKLKRKKG